MRKSIRNTGCEKEALQKYRTITFPTHLNKEKPHSEKQDGKMTDHRLKKSSFLRPPRIAVKKQTSLNMFKYYKLKPSFPIIKDNKAKTVHLNTCSNSSIHSRRNVQQFWLAIQEWCTMRKYFAYISSQFWSNPSLSHSRESRYHDRNPKNWKTI